MNLRQFLLIIRARYKVALLMMLAMVSIAQAVTVLQQKQYTATVSLVVDVRSPDPVAAMLVPLNMATQIEIINSDRVAQKVVKNLKLDENPKVKDDWIRDTEGRGSLETWLANLVKKRLSVLPSRDSNIISISYTGADPGLTATIANAFAQAYIETTIELKVEPARQYARWFAEQGKTLRENLEMAQAKLSAFQQERGILAKDEQVDSEAARLNDLTQRLTVVQGQMAEAKSKQRSGDAARTLPEVMQNPVISGLRADIVRQEAKLQEIGLNLGTNHPQYQRMESEIAALKRQLEAETRYITLSFATSRNVSKETETELIAAISAQKEKLLSLKSVRDQLAVLQRDVSAAQSAYDAVTTRLNQLTLASQATQANVTVLAPASEPIEPLTSKLFRNPWIAVFLGALLGIGAAVALEILDRRVRSIDDLAEMLQVPVLGVIENGRRRGRLDFGRRGTALLLR